MTPTSVIQNKREEMRIRAMSPTDSYSGFDLMTDISRMVNNAIHKSYNSLERKIFGYKSAPIAIFLYGSGGRGEMTNYSDIDIHFISTRKDKRVHILQDNLYKELLSYEFGKIDDPNWENMDSLENYAEKSITEANQIFDAKLIAGDQKLAKKLKKIITKYDTPERKVRNMLFQKFYLEHYYLNRSTPEMPNVKYCSGGYRDLLTFDWFYNWSNSTRGLPQEAIEGIPQIQFAIKDIGNKGIITVEQQEKMLESAEFMILFRNEILHANLKTNDKGITHLDIPTMKRTWYSSPEYFISLGATTSEQLLPLFQRHAKIIKNTKNVVMNYVISDEGSKQGGSWIKDYRQSLSAETSNERRKDIAERGDVITKLSSIWGMNYYANKDLFNGVCQQMADTTQWELLASMACSSKSSPELLDRIAKTSMEHEGLGYILRIIGRNSSVSKKTLEKISGNSSLDKRYRIVAKLHLEKGLYTATTRAS